MKLAWEFYAAESTLPENEVAVKVILTPEHKGDNPREGWAVLKDADTFEPIEWF